MGSKIKRLMASAIVIISLLVIFFLSLTQQQHDRFVGITESALLSRFGSPDIIDQFESERALDELRAPIYHQYGNLLIKEYFYQGLFRHQYFWLKEDSEKQWVVVDDIEFFSHTKF